MLHSWRRESLFHILQLSAQRFARHQVIFASYHLDWCEGVEFKVGAMTGACERSVQIVHPFRFLVAQLLVRLKDVINVANEALRPRFIDDVVLAHVPVYL